MRELKLKLRSLAQDVMGDTPINLDSPDDRSKLLYSREVNNKQVWKAIFNRDRAKRRDQETKDAGAYDIL